MAAFVPLSQPNFFQRCRMKESAERSFLDSIINESLPVYTAFTIETQSANYGSSVNHSRHRPKLVQRTDEIVFRVISLYKLLMLFIDLLFPQSYSWAWMLTVHPKT